jgi:membrane fusion protein, multidrug efflux system
MGWPRSIGVGMVICAVLSAIGGMTVLAQNPPQGSAPASPNAQRPPDAVPVQLGQAKRQDMPVLLNNIGAVQANQQVLVRARVDGTLTQIYFKEGQMVKAGDKLAEIDPRPYAAALASAMAKKAADTAMLATAEKDLTRTSNLVQRDFASRQQYDQQTGQVGQLQATLQGDDAAIANAQLNLNFCNITSPITGRVGLRMVDVGNLIHSNDQTGIVTVSQLQPIAVTFTLPQDDLPVIHQAMQAGAVPIFAYTADDKRQLGQGKLLTIDNQIDQATGTIKLKAEFPNEDSALWPGQFVNVRMQAATLKNALTVPSAAVQRGPQGLYVYLVKPDSRVAMQPVEVQQDDGKTAVIAKGLDEGVQVVVNGQSRLQTGSRVVASNPSSAS